MAHYALQKLRILPSTLSAMDDKELGFVYASIQMRIEEEKRENNKLRRGSGRTGRRR